MLTVKLFPDADAIANQEGSDFEVHYVSFVNDHTYGPPALIAPPARTVAGNPTPKRAAVGEEVGYVNLSLVPFFKIVRHGD